MSTESLQIIFDGDSHQIDANTLNNILIHFNSLIEITNKIYWGETKKIGIKVNAVKES